MGAEEIKILHVDDEESILKISQIILEEFDPHLRISNTTSPIKALKELESKEYDLVLSDYMMPEMNGIQLAEKIISQGIPFILYTGRGSEEVAEAAFKAGVDDYVRKEAAPTHLQVLARRIRQIVEQARGEKRLKVSEEKFRLFFMNQPVLCYIISKDGDIVEVNETVLDTLGYTREELIGKPVIPTLYSPSSRGRAEKLFRSGMETGRIRSEELNIVTKTGEEKTVLLNVDVVRDASGDIIQSISVQADITQRKRGEESLRESEERYRTLVENSPNAISVTVGDTIVYANQKRADLAGKNDPSELVGTSALSQVAEVDREPIIKIREARERGEDPPSPFEYRMTRADGSVRDIMDYHSEISFQGANAVQHVLHDITEEKRYERRLEALHRHATELGKASTMDDIAERTLNTIKSVLGYDQGGFGIVEGSVLHFKHMIGVLEGEGFEVPLDGKGITVKAVNTGRTVLVNDLRGDPDFVRGSIDSLSELATPVQVDGEIVAVLNIENLNLNAFTKEDQRLLETLAQHVASALSRLREVEKLRASEERYRTFLESSRDAVFAFDENKVHLT
jgi:PAS domain S-box-containing protein